MPKLSIPFFADKSTLPRLRLAFNLLLVWLQSLLLGHELP